MGIVKGELHSYYNSLYFTLIGLEQDFKTLFKKMNIFFSFKTHISTSFAQDIYGLFYLLAWSYFHDINVGRNILTNSQLKESFLLAATRKSKTKLRKTEKKTWKKKITTMKVTSSENGIPNSNSLKTFEFEPKNKHWRY